MKPPPQSMESPALKELSKHYPAHFRGRVPLRIRMVKHVVPDWPCLLLPGDYSGIELLRGKTYFCWVNSHGAVSGVCDNGAKLGVKPDEFVVTRYHAKEKSACNDSVNSSNMEERTHNAIEGHKTT